MKKSMKELALGEAGESVQSLDGGTGTIGGVPCSVVRSVSSRDGSTTYREYFFVVKDGQGLRIDFTTTSEDELRALEVSFSEYRG